MEQDLEKDDAENIPSPYYDTDKDGNINSIWVVDPDGYWRELRTHPF